jgi:hypothetical protein
MCKVVCQGSKCYEFGLAWLLPSGEVFLVVLQQCPRRWAIGEAVAAASAFSFEDFVHVMDVLHFWMDGAFGTNLTAKAAGDAETLDDSDFHRLLRST